MPPLPSTGERRELNSSSDGRGGLFISQHLFDAVEFGIDQITENEQDNWDNKINQAG
jgi:hypothetical protein